MKILWRIMYNLFITSKTQSWIYKSYIYLMKFAGCFDLLKTYFCLRIKIDKNCYWKSQFQSKQNSFSWKKLRIGRFRICCLIWWTSYWINMSWKKIPYVLVFTKQPCHACNIYNPNSHFQLKYIHIWDYWKTKWKYISIPRSLHKVWQWQVRGVTHS